MNHTSQSARGRHALIYAAAVSMALALAGCGIGTHESPTSGSTEPGTRGYYADKVDQVVSCQNGSYDFAGIGGVYQLDNNCDHVTVSGAQLVILAHDIGDLEVSGMGVEVYVAKLGSVTASGMSIKVRWESGSPKVDDSGMGNLLKHA